MVGQYGLARCEVKRPPPTANFMIQWLKNLFADRTFGAKRSPRWREVRAEHIRQFPNCASCGRKGAFLNPNEVHHCMPFNLDPSKELDPQNLITLCPDHHLFVGHLMNFRSYNKDVKQDAEIWFNKITARP